MSVTAAAAVREYFGTELNPQSFEDWLAGIEQAIATRQGTVLCGHHNLHSLYQLRRDRAVRQFYERCDDCYVDGVPVRWILAGFGVSTSTDQRFTLMDRFEDLLDHAQRRNWRLFYLGSHPDVVERARQLIGARFPELKMRIRHGYSSDATEDIEAIRDWQPDLLLVGMGMPLQERWLLQHLEQVQVAYVTEVGATLDYLVGEQRRPPLWLSRIGLGGLYRMFADPRRLWRRYLLEPWSLLPFTLRQMYRQARASKS